MQPAAIYIDRIKVNAKDRIHLLFCGDFQKYGKAQKDTQMMI
jgi:hypothetical protein